jgi:phosphoribosyl 1,2-cyclic phosphodiesterase
VRVQFWGTRGSIATPVPSMARYGGNTSCIEVRSAGGTLVIVDCGTGGHSLGQNLIAAGAKGLRGHIQSYALGSHPRHPLLRSAFCAR